jgi:addiction module HigA family antidote
VELSERLSVPIQRINTIIRGKRGVSAETALLLSREFGTTPQFWLNLQMACDLYDAEQRLSAAA